MILFCSRAGKPVSHDTVKVAFNKLRKKTGIEDVTIHDILAKSLTDADAEGQECSSLGQSLRSQDDRTIPQGAVAEDRPAPEMPIQAR
ncbi:hypothetical protein JQX08_02155 [Pseudomonas sp. UL073]|uniref:Uncharacterized protein n=1 Tax=Zestomonas insulae TaxID=2809017 RepID=A0ABS2I936_9GAMM|nr:hypothetical protein [Pseudomonas insulae]MBM7059500.1 hypothetical protein [Pseudomonas insulae]